MKTLVPQYDDEDAFSFKPPHLSADGALASLEAMAGELRIDAHERHLHDHLNSILDDRQKEIASVQSHAESALVQLATVREREQLQLSRRAEALQRDFREHLAELEHRYTLQTEGLKRDMLAKIAETKAACEAAIEAKAVELAEGLEAADRCPCAPAAPPAWEDAPEEDVGWRAGNAVRRRSPQENGRSMLLKQHTVSGTWQDTTGAKEPVPAGPGYKPCACRQSYRTVSTRPLRIGSLLDSDDEDY